MFSRKSNLCLLLFVFIVNIIGVLYLSVLKNKNTDRGFLMPLKLTANETIEDFVIEPIFTKKELVIWTNDYHATPVFDVKHLLKPFGVRVIDKNLYPVCHVPESCEGRKTLKLITEFQTIMDLDPKLIPRFYDAYKDDPEMKSVDAFICFHPASICELFEPFNKSMIIIASTRYELGRFSKERWTSWNNNLIRYASFPWNFVAGNNLYDVEYIKYFTGLQPQLLPSFCNYTNAIYNPTRPEFLVAFTRSFKFSEIFFKEHKEACKAVNCSVEMTAVTAKYGHYKYTDLTAHMGMVYQPYQVSVMSLFEQYRMNIPLFFPSKELLTRWQHKYMVMFERTWDGVYGKKPKRSTLDPHPSQSSIPDPNNEWDEEAIRYWIKFSDFYQWPHITYYESIPHLIEILEKKTLFELREISNRMRSYSVQAKKELAGKWKKNLLAIAEHSLNKPH